MKTLFLTLVLLSCMMNTIIPQGVPPVQGDVLINTFDPRVETRREEVIVLVNRTNAAINLNGYELQSFGPAGESDKYGYYLFSSSDIMPAYSFLLISSLTSVNGVSRDLVWTEIPVGTPPADNWPGDGYLALRKINPDTSADYIDIVKHVRSGFAFTGVPINSGLSVSDLEVQLPDTAMATRGGVSDNFSSLRFTGYLNYASDFLAVDQTTIIIQNSGSSPLPVELTSFSAIVLKDRIKLNWKTETEVNNYGFDIERSKKQGVRSEIWEKIGFVNGNGNSNSPKDYTFEDKNVTTGKYSYRLKQIDNDGNYQYSKVIEVDLSMPGKFELSQNYPNPFNPTTSIRFSIIESGNVKLTLYNILGQEIKTLVNEFKEAGVHTINFNASELNSGLYLYKLEANGLVQTRKMTLIK
jgi:hypothetical protein